MQVEQKLSSHCGEPLGDLGEMQSLAGQGWGTRFCLYHQPGYGWAGLGAAGWEVRVQRSRAARDTLPPHSRAAVTGARPQHPHRLYLLQRRHPRAFNILSSVICTVSFLHNQPSAKTSSGKATLSGIAWSPFGRDCPKMWTTILFVSTKQDQQRWCRQTGVWKLYQHFVSGTG